MTTQYTRNVLKMVVAQICQTVGWHSINSTPLEFMVDLMQEYLFQLSKLTQDYAQVLGRCDANLDDLGLAFNHMHIDIQELVEYVKNVDSVPCAISVPKLPIHRESHLNFLKPGSREVVSRPVHVHEHLPAMYPGTEEEYAEETKPTEITNITSLNESTNSFDDESNDLHNVVTTNGIPMEESLNKASSQAVFKRPGDPISFEGSALKRAKLTDEGRPLREIRSVIMTTSGFLSTAREGKLPEARTPQKARSESPPPPSYPMVPPEVKIEKKIKKIPKKSAISEDGKPENKENKKKKIPKDTLFQPDEIKEIKVKKSTGAKDIAKIKTIKPANKIVSPNVPGPSQSITAAKMQGKLSSGNQNPRPVKNIVPNNKVKAEKMDVIQNSGNTFLNDRKEEVIDKLPIEPDKQKLNIFKKISSKPKEDKERDQSEASQKVKLGSSENSPNLMLDEVDKYRNDLVIKQEDKKPIIQGPIVNNNTVRTSGTEDNVTNMMSPGSGSDVYMFDMSPPGTPSTPKTPELNVTNLSTEPKKKKKDKSGKKKESKPKTPRSSVSPKKGRLSSDSGDVNVLDRPKTPQAPEPPVSRDSNLPPTLAFPFFPFPPSPGLIPHPMFPLPIHKGLPGMIGPPNPAAMPNMLRHRFARPKIDGNRPLVPPSFVGENLQSPSCTFSIKPPQQQIPVKTPEVEVVPKAEPPSNFAHFPTEVPNSTPHANNAVGIPPPLMPTTVSAAVPAPLLPPNVPLIKPPKSEKSEKSEKKSKEHKKEKKEKLKKKKDKKDKHKEKGDKIKEKKDKSEKREKLEKIKEKKEKKEKRKEKEAIKKMKEEKLESVPKITLKLGPAGGSPRPPTPDSAVMKKITIKPPKKPEEEMKREPTPELARISALVTRPPKQKSTKTKVEAVPKKEDTKEDKENGGNALTTKPVTVDPNGRKVWICPGCGKQDDGSPMIGCDDCDAWYHWVCVGIQVAPAENEDWYCRTCLARKDEQYHDKKKKKRKKKVKLNA